MIITRTPLRISFCGGGTDFEGYYRLHGGQVISSAIDKYIYVTVNHKFDKKIHLRYSTIECVDKVDDLKHNIAREALKMVGVDEGVEIVIISDIPTYGSGLGSSSSLSVGLINALYAYKGKTLALIRTLAQEACKLEIDIMRSPIGMQDQYASAYGGFNKITFCEDGTVTVDRIEENLFMSDRIEWLKRATMLFYLNGRLSNDILVDHKNNIESKKAILDKQKMLCGPFLEWLRGKHDNYFLGELISLSWEFKKQMTPSATSDWIDTIIDSAIRAGAVGAKLCGAGGGGFLLVVCEPKNQLSVRNALKDILELHFSFEDVGSRTLHASI